MIDGIDIAIYNSPNWDELTEEGFKFAIIKVSEGINLEDPKWREHYDNAIAHDWFVGPYHYFRPQYTGVQQFDWHESITSKVNWHFPSMNDVEEESYNPGQSVYFERVRQFNDEAWAYWERRPLLYTSKYKWEKLCGGKAIDADLVVAHWTVAAQPFVPRGFSDWLFWQHWVDRERWLDLERFNGDMNALRKYAGVDEPIVYKTNVPKDVDKIVINLI